MELRTNQQQKYKYLMGSKKWAKETINKYAKDKKFSSEIYERKKIIEADYSKWKMYKALKRFKGKREYTNMLIYILTKYSQLTQKEITDKLKLRNENAIRQRLYKFRNKIKVDKALQIKTTELEKGNK